MDQDSGRKAGRSVPRRENGSGPRHRLDTDRPPAGAANPLPRRSAQGHIEPQLRTPGGAGTGTPFTPFGPDHEPAPAAEPGVTATGPGATATEPGASATPASGPGAPATGSAATADTSAAADFHEGADRGRRDAEPPAN